MLKDRKIIITGALGLVGKELLKIFCKTNQKIYAIDLQGQLNRYADFIKDIKMRNKNIHFIDCDINSKKFLDISKNVSSIIHLESDELLIFFEDEDDAQINTNPAKSQVATHYF